MIAYRICELKNESLYTLFHGINGSRKMDLNRWLTATVKDVSDGSRKTSKVYKSGFHVIPSIEECIKFLSKFRAKRHLVIVKCQIGKNYWKKEHSPSNILLAEKIKLLKIIRNENC